MRHAARNAVQISLGLANCGMGIARGLLGCRSWPRCRKRVEVAPILPIGRGRGSGGVASEEMLLESANGGEGQHAISV